MGNSRNELQKKYRKRLLEWYGGKCCVCGSTENLEFVHIQKTPLMGIGRGRKERYYDVLKHPEYYRLLCRSCHREFDSDFQIPFCEAE